MKGNGKHSKVNSTNKINSNNKILNIFLVVLIGIFIYSGYNVSIWCISNKKIKNLEEGLYSNVVSTTEQNDNGITEQIDFAKLEDINSDVIGWIKIDDTYINYPILKNQTKDYYLKKDIYKNYNISGSIFVENETNANFEDDNTIIYGHNMKNKRMFANLHKINRGELGSNIDVKIYTKSENSIYKVFSTYIDEPKTELFKQNFLNKKEKQNYINNAINRSDVKFDIDSIDYDSKIITLVTCDSNNKRRVFVNAIKCAQ